MALFHTSAEILCKRGFAAKEIEEVPIWHGRKRFGVARLIEQ